MTQRVGDGGLRGVRCRRRRRRDSLHHPLDVFIDRGQSIRPLTAL
jgi:hypothetical protein